MAAAPTSLNEHGLIVGAEDMICTYSGGWFRPLDPDPALIYIEDIAQALANQCRFTGHTEVFSSVAEHSVLASRIRPEEDPLEKLLHDGSEGYLADLARPIKRAPGLGEVYREAEARLEQAIAIRFGTKYPKTDAVEYADQQMLYAEIHTMLPQVMRDLYPEPNPETPRPVGWSPKRAKREFLTRFEELTS